MQRVSDGIKYHEAEQKCHYMAGAKVILNKLVGLKGLKLGIWRGKRIPFSNVVEC